ncbi:MAG: hypothetical protein ACOZIN_00940 [Myxococcota bacterium]
MRTTPAVLAFCLAFAATAAEPKARPSPSFPLPALDGKVLSAAEGQKQFRVPWGFARVERFYREHFIHAPDVTLSLTGPSGARTLTLVNRKKGDAWVRAVVREGEIDTRIEVTAVLRLAEERVEGRGVPLVELVIPRAPEAAKAAAELDHTSRD